MLPLHRLATIVTSLIFLIFLQVYVSPSTAQTQTSAEEEVLKVSRTWLDARNHRDLGTFAAFMADDFIGTTDIGERTTKGWLVDYLSKRGPEDEQKIDLRDVKVHIEGDTAIVNYLITVHKGWGHYDWPRHKIDDRDTFTVKDGHLYSEWRGVKSECLAKAKDTFFQRDDSGWWTFVRDRQGHVTGYIYYYPDGQEVPVTRID